jgi:hypothetical protein
MKAFLYDLKGYSIIVIILLTDWITCGRLHKWWRKKYKKRVDTIIQ